MQATDLSSARLYAILDTAYVEDHQWESVCVQLIAGNADLIQLRAKERSRGQKRELLERILPLFASSATPLIINDDVELALEFPGLGIHIGQDDGDVAETRKSIGPDRILGLSTHSPEQARAAIAQSELLNYFAVGPVFATQTKPDYTPVGLRLVETVSKMHPPIPWFCIGGIKRTNLDSVIAAGGRRAVVVSEILESSNPPELIGEYRARLKTG